MREIPILARFARDRPAETETPAAAAAAPRRHSLGEDFYAFLIGCSFAVIGLTLLRHSGLVTGGTAGLALLLSYIVPLPPGLLLLMLNLPFFLLAKKAMGEAFMVKTIIVSLLITLMAFGAPHVITLARLDPLFSALFGGTIIGMGILALARHGAGVGGTGVVALALLKRKGWNAGRTQLVLDCMILALALPVVSWQQLALSVVSAAAMTGVLIAYHKPGRYIGY